MARHLPPALLAVQVILAVVIVVLVASQLDHVTWDNGQITATKATCTLGTSFDSASLCVYTYIVAGVSMAVSLGMVLLMCITANLCGIGKHLTMFIAGLGTVWWAIAGALVQKNLNTASTAAEVVSGMVWAETGLFGLLLVSSLLWACGCAKRFQYEEMV